MVVLNTVLHSDAALACDVTWHTKCYQPVNHFSCQKTDCKQHNLLLPEILATHSLPQSVQNRAFRFEPLASHLNIHLQMPGGKWCRGQLHIYSYVHSHRSVHQYESDRWGRISSTTSDSYTPFRSNAISCGIDDTGQASIQILDNRVNVICERKKSFP
jgi:hypothetical protein